MKSSWIIPLLTLSFSAMVTETIDAVGVAINVPGLSLSVNQPIPAVVVDASGNTSNQTVYYDPSVGGVDLNAGWAGANASVYFPSLNTGYVWYNGYWVDPAGYYYNGGKRYYVGDDWNRHWNGYWQGRGHWNGQANGHAWYGEHDHAWQRGTGEWRGGEERGFRDERAAGERDFRGGREAGGREEGGRRR